MNNIDWNPANILPKDRMPILISFENCRYPLIGFYSEFSHEYAIDPLDRDDCDYIHADKFGKVNGWTPLPRCKNYVEKELNGVISKFDPVFNTVDIIVFHDDIPHKVIMRREIIDDLELEEGDSVIVGFVNEVPTKCYRNDYVDYI